MVAAKRALGKQATMAVGEKADVFVVMTAGEYRRAERGEPVQRAKVAVCLVLLSVEDEEGFF